MQGHGLLYHEIEEYVKVCCNTVNQESALIAQVWPDLQKSGEKMDISK